MEGFYMFKKGFTLAEVLITLGIVGVIAAITLPTLTQSTTTAQIGPKLAKAASAFEQANKALLDAYDVDRFSDTNLSSGGSAYVDALSNHFNFSYDGTNIVSKDGIGYVVSMTYSKFDDQMPAHKQRLGLVTVDINGPKGNPNASGTDIFNFSLWNDGSLRPMGGTNWFGGESPTAGSEYHWTVQCPNGATPADPDFCAGHVFENNLKVLYR